MNNTKRPNPERVYATIAAILQRRYEVRIEYTLTHQEPKGANT